MSGAALLAALGEDGLLHSLTSRWKSNAKKVVVGVGDDCAVLRGKGKNSYLLFKTDAVVEGVHFLPRENPGLIGARPLPCPERSCRDGGEPFAALITLGVTKKESLRRLKGIYAGWRRPRKSTA